MSRERERFVKLRQSFWRHPGVRLLSKGARWAYVAGLSYCMDEETDGVIAQHVARTMLDATKREIAELVDAGFWLASKDGYEVHDYLKHNASKADMTAARAKMGQGGRKGGGSNRASNEQGTLQPTLHGSSKVISKLIATEEEEELTPPTPLGRGEADDGPPRSLGERVGELVECTATPGSAYRLLSLLSDLHADDSGRPYLQPGIMCSAADRTLLGKVIQVAERTASEHGITAMAVIAGEWVALIALVAAGEAPERIGNALAYFAKRFGTLEVSRSEAAAPSIPARQSEAA